MFTPRDERAEAHRALRREIRYTDRYLNRLFALLEDRIDASNSI
jgi:hypothetical protein